MLSKYFSYPIASGVVNLIEKTVQTTGDIVKLMVDCVMSDIPAPVDAKPNAPFSNPAELNRDHYPLVKWWAQGSYQATKNGNDPKDNEAGPTISLYMQDENGVAISAGIKSALRRDLFAYWNRLKDAQEKLTLHSGTSLERKDHFRATFEAKYPWLQLCEGH
jgi:hypothetical protein